jgi:hypothetical protein
MAQYGIQYTPQFVQSDIGAMQRKFDDLQQGYDTAYAGALAAEDQFGQFDVDQRDIELKNEVLGGFKNRVKSLVDRYGGDWSAASKQLASEIVRTKNDKFFPIAARRKMLAEEQRRAASQPGAIILKDVRNVDLRDKDGNWINPEDLDYKVTTRDALRKELELGYADLAKKITEGGYESVKGVPWIMRKAVTKGITDAEVPEVANNMLGTLKQMYPELDDKTAQSIAVEQANQLVGGTQYENIDNWWWKQQQEEATYNRRRAAETPPPPEDIDLFERGTGNLVQQGENAELYNDARDDFQKAAKNIPLLKDKISKVEANYERIKNDKNPTIRNQAGAVLVGLNKLKKDLEENRAKYKDSEAKIAQSFPIYQHLKDKGVSSTDAWTATAKQINRTDSVFKTTLDAKTPAETSKALGTMFSRYDGDIYEEKDGKRSKSSYNIAYVTDPENIKTWGIQGNNVSVVVRGRDKSGKPTKELKTIILPLNKTKSNAVNQKANYMETVRQAYSGNNGIGKFRIKQDGSIERVNKNDPDYNGYYKGMTYVNAEYNPVTKRIDSSIFDTNSRNPEVTIDGFVSSYANDLMRTLGKEVKFEDYKVE